MFGVFKKVINFDVLFNIQDVQYSEKLFLEDTIPAGSEKMSTLAISSHGHFYCKYITGHISTLFLDGGNIKDDGVSHLRAKIIDGGTSRDLTNTYVPLDLLLSPGRVKSNLSTTLLTTDAPSNTLFYPLEWEYMFSINSYIEFHVKNDSNTPNTFAVCLHGIRRKEVKYIPLKKEK